MIKQFLKDLMMIHNAAFTQIWNNVTEKEMTHSQLIPFIVIYLMTQNTKTVFSISYFLLMLKENLCLVRFIWQNVNTLWVI